MPTNNSKDCPGGLSPDNPSPKNSSPNNQEERRLLNRRAFLRTAGLATLGGTLLHGAASPALASTGARAADPDAMGVLVDLTKCNGCRECEAACARVSGFDVPSKETLLDESVFAQPRRPGPRSNTAVNRTALIVPPVDAEFSNGMALAAGPAFVYAKLNCMHCVDPACVSACLVGAMRKEPNGAVSYDAGKCMGCRYCMVACPFQLPTYEYSNVLTPQVRKCSFCSNEGNPNQGKIPACVQACPRQCLTYGKRSDLLAMAHERIERHAETYLDHVYGEHEAGGTSWLYLSAVPFASLAFPELGAEAPPRRSEAIQHGVFSHFMPPVAWCGILGLITWLSKPSSTPSLVGAGDGHPTDSRQAAALVRDTNGRSHRAESTVSPTSKRSQDLCRCQNDRCQKDHVHD